MEQTKNHKKLYRSSDDKIIAGVCGGLAEFLGIDSTIVRLIFIVLTFFSGLGILLYIVGVFLIPKEGQGVVSKETMRESAEELADRVKEAGKGLRQSGAWLSGKTLFGLVLILVGILFLLNNLFPFYFAWLDWEIFWPLVIIFIGLALMLKN